MTRFLNNQNKVMKRRPRRNLNSEDERAIEEFISGAEEPPSPRRGAQEGGRREDVYPWEEPQVRQDVKQTYPLRLPEPLHLKLKFVSKRTGKSMNELCNAAVGALVENKLEELMDTDRES